MARGAAQTFENGMFTSFRFMLGSGNFLNIRSENLLVDVYEYASLKALGDKCLSRPIVTRGPRPTPGWSGVLRWYIESFKSHALPGGIWTPGIFCCVLYFWASLAVGESAIKCSSPLNVLKDTYDYSCY
jgi:hypothetical protein